MLEKIGLSKEQINSAIRIWFWTSGFIFLISLIALVLTWKERNLYLILTVVIFAIIFLIMIWKYPKKEKVEEDYTEPEITEDSDSSNKDFAKKELNEDQEDASSSPITASPVSNQDKQEVPSFSGRDKS